VTLNGLELRNSPYFANSISLEADYITVVEERPIMFAEYHFPLLASTGPPCIQRGVSAIAELLVIYWNHCIGMKELQ